MSTRIPPANLQELNVLWNADPARRLPTLLSRRRWAEARNLDVNLVHRWWRDKRFKARKNKLSVSDTETYDIPVGIPPAVDPDNQAQPSDTKVKAEDQPIVIKTEPIPITLRDAPYTRTRARIARALDIERVPEEITRVSSPPSSPPSLFDRPLSPDTSPPSSQDPNTPSKCAYTHPNDENIDIYQLSLPEPKFHDVQVEDSQQVCTLGADGIDGFVCQMCSADCPDPSQDKIEDVEMKDFEALYTQLTGGVFSSDVPDSDSTISWHLSAIPFDSRSPDMLSPTHCYAPDSRLTFPFQNCSSSIYDLMPSHFPSIFTLDGCEFTCNGYLLRECDSPEDIVMTQAPFTFYELAGEPFDYLPSLDAHVQDETPSSTIDSPATTPESDAGTLVTDDDVSATSTVLLSEATTPRNLEDDTVIVKNELDDDDTILSAELRD
ncbi:hypothetical protein VKT23_010410 [Stygiomarasmius scandens]|uniref:Uncharacterized protein n=1 Tax=Marasmiellus scandens TaxID=2682957 RepID=A0ABR1JBK3_9AGAR